MRYQRILLGLGFTVGPQGADGRFAANTANGVQAFARWYDALPEGAPASPADLATSRDAFGNISSYFQVTDRHHALTVVGTSVVEVDPGRVVGVGPVVTVVVLASGRVGGGPVGVGGSAPGPTRRR